VLEHFPDTLVGLGGALEILLGTNLLADVLGLEVKCVSGASRTAVI
jgi:hypothetical protein